MQVEISLYATLRRWLPEGARSAQRTIEVAEGATVGQLLENLNAPLDEVQMIFVNGRHAKADTVLADGDRIGVFPAIGGG